MPSSWSAAANGRIYEQAEPFWNFEPAARNREIAVVGLDCESIFMFRNINGLGVDMVRRRSCSLRGLVAYGPFPQFDGGWQRFIFRFRYSAGMAEKIV